MEKRYQVFISSTYQDLKEERQELIAALLELDCIPVGMELFPAANDDQWTLITQVIDSCDYYVLVVAGRYGSISETTGLSYTEMEYGYAVEKKIPVMAFLHENPGSLSADKSEQDQQAKEKFEKFKGSVRSRMCKYWGNAGDLGGKVSRALIKQIKSNPRVGWVRADAVPETATVEEILKLTRERDELKMKLQEMQVTGPPGNEDLQQGDDQVSLTMKVRHPAVQWQADTTWNEVFKAISPFMVDHCAQAVIRYHLGQHLKERLLIQVGEGQFQYTEPSIVESFLHNAPPPRVRNLLDEVDVDAREFAETLVQFRALGLVIEGDVKPVGEDYDTFWKLTPYGAHVMTKLCAKRRSHGEKLKQV